MPSSIRMEANRLPRGEYREPGHRLTGSGGAWRATRQASRAVATLCVVMCIAVLAGCQGDPQVPDPHSPRLLTSRTLVNGTTSGGIRWSVGLLNYGTGHFGLRVSPTVAQPGRCGTACVAMFGWPILKASDSTSANFWNQQSAMVSARDEIVWGVAPPGATQVEVYQLASPSTAIATAPRVVNVRAIGDSLPNYFVLVTKVIDHSERPPLFETRFLDASGRVIQPITNFWKISPPTSPVKLPA